MYTYTNENLFKKQLHFSKELKPLMVQYLQDSPERGSGQLFSIERNGPPLRWAEKEVH